MDSGSNPFPALGGRDWLDKIKLDGYRIHAGLGARLRAHVVAADKAQPICDLVANRLRHRGRAAGLFPFGRVDHTRRREVVERAVLRIAAARPETARA